MPPQLITAKGREEVSQDPTGSGWPYTPKPLREVLGPAFVDKSGNQVTLESLAGKTLALYFSASWCPPCRKYVRRTTGPVHWHPPPLN